MQDTDSTKEKDPPAASKAVLSRRSTPKKMGLRNTLGAQFKQQLATLMDTLNSTDPHFVRCMKPNMEKVGTEGVCVMVMWIVMCAWLWCRWAESITRQ